jgi:hypothetical protein
MQPKFLHLLQFVFIRQMVVSQFLFLSVQIIFQDVKHKNITVAQLGGILTFRGNTRK